MDNKQRRLEALQAEMDQLRDELDAEKPYTVYTDPFYRLTDREQRLKHLDDRIKAEGLTQENKLRKEICLARYDNRNDAKIDYFIRGWVVLGTIKPGGFRLGGKKGLQKQAQEVLKDWQMERAEQYGEVGEECLKGELYNMALLYIELCHSDRTYNSVLWGIGKIKDEKLIGKIGRDFYTLTVTIPEQIGMTEKFDLFREAAQRAYADTFPEYAHLMEKQEK